MGNEYDEIYVTLNGSEESRWSEGRKTVKASALFPTRSFTIVQDDVF